MKHDELQDLLAAYALDAVDPDEGAAVEEHLRECGRCRADVADFREAATLLAHSGADAPAGLWERIAGSLEEAPPGLRLIPDTGDRPRGGPRSRSRWATAAIAVGSVAAAVALGLGLQVRDQGSRIHELESALEDPVRAAYATALAEPDSDIIELASSDGRLAVRAVVTASGVGYLQASGLPELPDDRAYQLWGGAGDQMVSLGVLGDDPEVVTFPGRPYSVLAITEEAASGAVAPTSSPVVQGGTA